MRRPIIAAIAISAAIVLAGGAVAGVVAYRGVESRLSRPVDAPPTATQIAEYRQIVNGWPYPFAKDDAVPKTPPIQSGNRPSRQNDRTFVSFFYQCSWVNAALHGPASSRATALLSLNAWNSLPLSISSADNSDGGWKSSVLDPAAKGDLRPLQEYFASCAPYKTYRTSPGAGMVVDRPLPGASSVPSSVPTPSYQAAAIGDGMVGTQQVEIPVDNGAENTRREP